MSQTLNQNTITFGKYKNQNLQKMLKDRNYCNWLIQQDFFKTSYEYLYNRIIEYKPILYFLKPGYENNIKIIPEVKQVESDLEPIPKMESAPESIPELELKMESALESQEDELLFISSLDELKTKKKSNSKTKTKPNSNSNLNSIPNILENILLPSFLNNYAFFNLRTISELETENILHLEEYEKQCYEYYLLMIDGLKQQIINNIHSKTENSSINIYDITAPTKWLQNFERTYCMSRDLFKEFINSYDLPNIPMIIEHIKEQGGLTYKGGKSFLIAKERSKKQENFWEELLKSKYGENIGTQYKYKNCIFDFINIPKNIIYECKLSLKDFDEEQLKKYNITLNVFNIIYLISTDCAINITEKKIYTTNNDKYCEYIANIYDIRNPTYLDNIIEDFDIVELEKIENILEKI